MAQTHQLSGPLDGLLQRPDLNRKRKRSSERGSVYPKAHSQLLSFHRLAVKPKEIFSPALRHFRRFLFSVTTGRSRDVNQITNNGKQELVIKILSFVLVLHSDVGGAKPAGKLFFLRRLAGASLGSALLLLPPASAPRGLPRLAHHWAPSHSEGPPHSMHVCGTALVADLGCSHCWRPRHSRSASLGLGGASRPFLCLL